MRSGTCRRRTRRSRGPWGSGGLRARDRGPARYADASRAPSGPDARRRRRASARDLTCFGTCCRPAPGEREASWYESTAHFLRARVLRAQRQVSMVGRRSPQPPILMRRSHNGRRRPPSTPRRNARRHEPSTCRRRRARRCPLASCWQRRTHRRRRQHPRRAPSTPFRATRQLKTSRCYPHDCRPTGFRPTHSTWTRPAR